MEDSDSKQVGLKQQDLQQRLYAIVDPLDTKIPQTLLPISRARPVLADLKLTTAQHQLYFQILKPIDLRWWQSRQAPLAEQRLLIAELETDWLNQVKEQIGVTTAMRLQQIEIQAQGPRLMRRPDVARAIQFTDLQQLSYRQLVTDTENKIRKINQQQQLHSDKNFNSEFTLLKANETNTAYQLLTDSQKKLLANVLGTMLDHERFTRVYPKAPELIESNHWANVNSSLNLSLDKGKITVVVFYRFQSESCRGDLPLYRDWFERFQGQPVQLIGIQSPETAAELDPDLVRMAIDRDRLRFPVLIDLQNKNREHWCNRNFPSVYIVDQEGFLRYWWYGPLKSYITEENDVVVDSVQTLLQEKIE